VYTAYDDIVSDIVVRRVILSNDQQAVVQDFGTVYGKNAPVNTADIGK